MLQKIYNKVNKIELVFMRKIVDKYKENIKKK